ncbi:MAG: TIGR03619 family F420-dependent LLM class oxidoreductase [Solirubrobacterales bacterium]|nr:TIGR03619 family F420-dependent LLM class oxidoreductase [Solirubrobacterales bacterium]
MHTAPKAELGAVISTPSLAAPTGDALARHSRLAEEAGATSLWVDDHLAQIRDSSSPYPFASDGEATWEVDTPIWESLTSLAFIAAATERATIGTAVLILPQRHVIELAKTTATLDVLSGGRLVLGCGVGWLAEEMEALGWSFHRRGARANEQLDALRACWTGHPPPFEGEHVTLPAGLVMEPTPLQQPGPPLLVGGMSKAARRRAAERGDGWLALATADTYDTAELADQIGSVRELRAAGPRAAEPFRASFILGDWPEDRDRLIARAIEAAELGFDEIILEPDWSDPDLCATTIAEAKAALDG